MGWATYCFSGHPVATFPALAWLSTCHLPNKHIPSVSHTALHLGVLALGCLVVTIVTGQTRLGRGRALHRKRNQGPETLSGD